MNVQSTKAIARKTGMSVAQVNEMARDLNIKMNYREDNRYWEIQDRMEASILFGECMQRVADQD